MTVSVRVMSAGGGYRYLLRTVVAGDGVRSLSTPLTRYYAEAGTPPGYWMGNGLAALGGGGVLFVGEEVTGQQLQLLLGMGRDPVTGEALGRAYPEYTPVSERIEQRVSELDPMLSEDERDAAVAELEAAERAVVRRRAVAGYDFTFSVPKSVSVLWAVSDAATQERIVDLHHEAVGAVLGFLEREVAATRTGVAAVDGAVAQVPVLGVVAAAYDHYDSRAGDPHLHTHVVVSNKVQTVLDGRWRSLDGRPLLASAVALSELHEALVADLMTREFGVGWQRRERGRDRNPVWDVAGVPEELLHEFSSRSVEIDRETDRLAAAYRTTHGRRPSAATVLRLRAEATLSTRPPKQVRSLQELTAGWRRRAGKLLGGDPVQWARDVTIAVPSSRATSPSSATVDSRPVAELAVAVVAAVGEKRSTWHRWNLHAEASRQLKGHRFPGLEEREAATARVVEAAEARSLRLTPPEIAPTPVEFQRADGSSVFRPHHSALFTSSELLDAEQRLLDRAERRSGPKVADAVIARALTPSRRRGRLSADKVDAVHSLASSGRVLDVLVGPAGSGKTTAMSALWAAWEAGHGRGSVVGLAPSAAAAEVLAQELGIGTENTAKWLHDHAAGTATFRAGQLVILDEASLASTRTLDAISGTAEQAGAKVVLVGDWAQLQAVAAGGAFGLLAQDRDDVAELTDVRRFVHPWEKDASVHLRHGRPEAIDTYVTRGRVHGGDTEQITEAAYTAWTADRAAGKTSLLIAQTTDTVRLLNDRARAERILTTSNAVRAELQIAGGSRASVGDAVITRRNQRTLHAGRTGWVRNGDRWTVTRLHLDGSVTVRRAGYRRGATVHLQAAYVREHLDLGYAVTGHGAQGVTVDTAHAIVLPGTTREQLYVALTRGRQSNVAYVATDRLDPVHEQQHPGQDPDLTAVSVLHGVLRAVGAEQSAHETCMVEQERWGSIAQLAAEYETIAAAAQHDRWAALVRATALTRAEADGVVKSAAFGALCAELRWVEAFHHDVDRLLPMLVSMRSFDGAENIAAVLHARLERATAQPASGSRGHLEPRLILGLVPEAHGPQADEVHCALVKRQQLLGDRAIELARRASDEGRAWTVELAELPRTRPIYGGSTSLLAAVAAYRERYAMTSEDALGPVVGSAGQRRCRALLDGELRRALGIRSRHGGVGAVASSRAVALEVAP